MISRTVGIHRDAASQNACLLLPSISKQRDYLCMQVVLKLVKISGISNHWSQ